MVWLEPHSIHPVRKIIRKGAEKILRRGLRQDELDYFTTRLHANRQRQSQTQDRLGPHALSELQTPTRATYCLSENAQAIQMGKEPTPSKHREAQDEPVLANSGCPGVLRSWPSPVSPTGRNRSKIRPWSIRVRMDQGRILLRLRPVGETGEGQLLRTSGQTESASTGSSCASLCLEGVGSFPIWIACAFSDRQYVARVVVWS